MENSSFKKQAKSDIFKELQPIISFYIKKGAKPKALKKYYKNNKRRQKFTEYRWLNWDKSYSTAGEVTVFDDNVIVILSNIFISIQVTVRQITVTFYGF